jgi:hypothetical protein
MSSSAIRRVVVLAIAVVALAGADQASATELCTVPTVSNVVRAADGRVYVRAHNQWCSATWRITTQLYRDGALANSGTAYYWSGDGAAGVFSVNACVRGASYQGRAFVDAYYNSAWHRMSSASGAISRLC